MKKVLSVIAVALVAALSHAATIQWQSGTMYVAADADGTWAAATSANRAKGSVTAVYLIVSAAVYNDYASDAEKIYNNWSTLSAGAIRKSSEIVSNNGGTANWSDSTVVSASDGTIYGLALYTYSHDTYGDFYLAAAGSAAVNDAGDISGSNKGLASNVGKWTPVPEPTSVALLALGLAAVGLKRKVA